MVKPAKPVIITVIFTLWISLSGCSLFVSNATDNLATNLSRSILNQQDPDTVRDGLPSYLLLLDAMIYDSADNIHLLRSAALLNSAYASLFVEDKSRQKVLSDKALDYAARSVCLQDAMACDILSMPYEKFEPLVETINRDSLPAYYALASTWAGWVQANSDDWNAIAQLAKIEHIMKRVIAVDETYQYGGAHLYLGVIATLLPPAMGGRPEVGKLHFEKSIELSQGKNLMAKVTYAERYARMMFDRDMHDALLIETIQTETEHENLTLMNTIAKQKARQLLASSNDYF